MFQREKTKKTKGITLISLVITIIIMLILAGVAVNLAIDSNGLFGKANEAGREWNAAVQEEKEAMLQLEAKYYELGLESNSENEMVAYYIDEVPIPKGFTYIEGTKATGLVIKNTKDGNEFVWIPADAEEIKTANATNVLYDETAYPQALEMMDSIEEYGGYYMARYAAGADVEITTSGQMETVYSQAGKFKYICGSYQQMIDLCASMYPDDDTNETGVLSHHQLEGMTIYSVYDMGCFPEEITTIKESYGVVVRSDNLMGLLYLYYKESSGKWIGAGCYFVENDLRSMLNLDIFNYNDGMRI